MVATPVRRRQEDPSLRYRALLDVCDCIALHQDLPELFRDLAYRLHRIIDFNFVYFVLHDSQPDVPRLNVVEIPKLEISSLPGELSEDSSAGGYTFCNQQPLLIFELSQEQRFQESLQPLRERGVRSLCLLPMTAAQHRLGVLGFGSLQPAAYGEADEEFLLRVAQQVAVAVDSALSRRQAQELQREVGAQLDRAQLLLDLNNALVSNLDVRDLFSAISRSLRGLMRHDYASLVLHIPGANRFRLHALDFPEGKGLVREGFEYPMEGTPGRVAFETRQPLLLDRIDFESYSSEITRRMLQEGVKSACWVPLITANRVLGTLSVASLQPSAFRGEDVELLVRVASQISVALENALAYKEIAELKDRLAEEKLYLEDEIRSEHNFEEIVGESPAIKRVLDQVRTVAPTDAAVLILGETGTGKELIARAIHGLSTRKDHTFVKLNCSAIPTGLLESELFGHEKGAFTGAISQKVGRFELADGGTLFLDEVGDIPLELQPKLLRALQEREFERLGSNRTVRVNARLIAATNRDLPEMVASREFRNDLFYRLNVFPLIVPPLRQRAGDTPLLVRYFTEKHAKRMNRVIQTIPAETMRALTRWRWPGNVRELENLVERAVILSRGPVLHVPLAEVTPAGTAVEFAPPSTLEEAERLHIVRVLRETRGVIAGPNGAATRLGMKRTTLNYKMKKLGINHRTI